MTRLLIQQRSRPGLLGPSIGMVGLLLLASSVGAQEKTTFQDQILPLVQANCAKCHNADKKKADLDLTSYASLLKGSGSGAVVASGDPAGSKLWKAISHSEEPFMPPNSKLPDKELEVFKKWIAGGLLENAAGKAVVAKGGADLELKPAATGKPDGPPPMPLELPLEPVVHTARRTSITGLASSPWAPLAAVAGQRQVLLFNTDTLELLGILPFTEGQPVQVKFSQNGKVLLAAGGRAAKSGRVFLWDVVTGEPLSTIGKDEFDTVLSADLKPDQSDLALGGPSRLVKIYSVKDGEVRHRLKKHTDWVTALSYSPNGQFLASADRNGGITIWDAESAQELFTLSGHKSSVTALSWRLDSKFLASASEDGTAAIWETSEGKQVKSWPAHAGGALSICYGSDGQLVSGGRDNKVTIWDANGGKPRQCEFFGNLAVKAIFSHDAKRVLASDFEGRLGVWTVADQKRAGELDPNPLPISVQLVTISNKVSELQAKVTAAAPGMAVAQEAVTKATALFEEAKTALEAAVTNQVTSKANVAALSSQLSSTNAPADLPARLAAASTTWSEACTKATNATALYQVRSTELENAKAKLAAAKAESPEGALTEAKANLAKLEATQSLLVAWQLRPTVSAKKREHDSLAAAISANRETVKQSEKELAVAKEALAKAESKLKAAQTELAKDEPAEKQLASDLAAQQARLDALLNQYRAALKIASPVTEARK